MLQKRYFLGFEMLQKRNLIPQSPIMLPAIPLSPSPRFAFIKSWPRRFSLPVFPYFFYLPARPTEEPLLMMTSKTGAWSLSPPPSCRKAPRRKKKKSPYPGTSSLNTTSITTGKAISSCKTTHPTFATTTSISACFSTQGSLEPTTSVEAKKITTSAKITRLARPGNPIPSMEDLRLPQTRPCHPATTTRTSGKSCIGADLAFPRKPTQLTRGASVARK